MKTISIIMIFVDYFLPVHGEFTAGELEKLRKLIGLSFSLLIARIPIIFLEKIPMIYKILASIFLFGVFLNPILLKVYNMRKTAEILFTVEWFSITFILSVWFVKTLGPLALPALASVPQFIFFISSYCGYLCSALVALAMMYLFHIIEAQDQNFLFGLFFSNGFYCLVSSVISLWYDSHSKIQVEHLLITSNPTTLTQIKRLIVEKDRQKSIIFTNLSMIGSCLASAYFNVDTVLPMSIIIILSVITIIITYNAKYLSVCSNLTLVIVVAALFCSNSKGKEFLIGYTYFVKATILFGYFIGGWKKGFVLFLISLYSLLYFKSHWENYLTQGIPMALHLVHIASLCYFQEVSLEKSIILFRNAVDYLEKVRKISAQEEDFWNMWLKSNNNFESNNNNKTNGHSNIDGNKHIFIERNGH